MTPKLRGVVAAASCCFAMFVASEDARAEVVVAAGRSVTLMTLASIDQVCHSQGPITVNVLVPPQGGFIEIMQVKAYPNFNVLNTRSRCNTLKLPATQVIYQSAGTFLGLDYVTVEVIFPEGAVRRVRVPISVRPVVTPGEAALAGVGAGVDPLAPSGQPTPDAAVVPARPRPVHHAKRPVVAAQAAHRHEAARPAPPAVREAPPAQKPLLENI